MDEELQTDMFVRAEEILENAGYIHYEISNYSLPGYESRHNINYWKRNEYIGVGAGAHSFLKDYKWGRRWENIRDPEEYMRGILTSGKAIYSLEVLSKREAIEEKIFLGLRLMEGIKLDDFFIEFGIPLYFLFNREIEELKEEGLILMENGYIKLTKRGIIFSDEVFSKFALI